MKNKTLIFAGMIAMLSHRSGAGNRSRLGTYPIDEDNVCRF